MPVSSWPRLFVGTAAPATGVIAAQSFWQEQSLAVGDVWSDTAASLLKRCTSIAPVTFVSVELGTPVTIANGGTGLSANPVIDAFISASALKGTTTNPAGDANRLPADAETAVNGVNYDYMAFTAGQKAFFQYRMPVGWDEGTVTFRYLWTATGGAGTVTMGLEGLALSDDDALDTAFGTQVTVTDTLLATNDVHVSPASAAVTIGGTPAAQDLCLFELTLTVLNPTGFRLLGINLSFTRDSYTD